MPDLSFTGTLLPGARAILEEHQREMPQKNELCGAFWVTLALRVFAGAGSGRLMTTVTSLDVAALRDTFPALSRRAVDDAPSRPPRVALGDLLSCIPFGATRGPLPSRGLSASMRCVPTGIQGGPPACPTPS